MQAPLGWGAAVVHLDHSAGLITALGPWEPPRGRSNGQPSLLVRHRSSAEGRWVEAYRQTALGSVVCCRYSGCGVDNCGNVSSVGQPKTMKLTQAERRCSWPVAVSKE